MNKIIFLSSILLFTLLFSACTPDVGTDATLEAAAPESQMVASRTPADLSFTVTDALGREVRFEQPPERIILAGRALFMIADAVYLFPGTAERIVVMGQTDQGSENFIALIDPAYSEKALLSVNSGAEQVAAYQPDLVILKSYLAQSLGSGIETLGIPVVYIDFETPEQYERDLRILGTVLQNEARAEEAIAFFQEQLNAVTGKIGALPEEQKPRVLLLSYSNKDGTVAFNVPPAGWIQTRMVTLAGGVPVWTDANLSEGWSTVSLEQIAAWDADTIFITSYFKDPDEVKFELMQDENWALLRAVQDGHLYAFATDFFSWDQPDTRWILGLQWLAAKLHPELFSDFDIVAAARDFYGTLYGLDAAFFDEQILPNFKGDLP